MTKMLIIATTATILQSIHRPNEDFVQLKFTQGYMSNGAPLEAQTVKNLLAMQETWSQPLGLKKPSGEGNGNPLQYSYLENPMDRGVWWATVHWGCRVRHN